MHKFLFQIALLITFCGYSQATFKPGYFIDKVGNKHEGLINYNNPVDNPKSFEFKATEADAQVTTLTLNNTAVVEVVDDVKFINTTVLMDRHSDRINSIEYGKELVLNNETHFLKYLVEGEYDLLVYDEQGLQKFFYAHNSGNIHQLGYKEYYADDNTTKANEQYKKQLWDSVKCGLPNAKLIDDLKYRQDPLVDYFNKINECKTGKKPKEAKKYKSILNVKVGAFFNVLTLKNSDEEFTFGTKNTLTASAQLEYVFPYFNYKWSLFIEPTFLKYSKTVPYHNIYYYMGYNNANVNVDQTIYHLPIGVTYRIYNKEKFKVFASYSFGLLTVFKNNYYSIDANQGYILGVDQTHMANRTIGIGVTYKDFDFLFTVQPVKYYGNGELLLTRTALGLRYTLFTNKKK